MNTVMITGAAAGIGLITAKRFAREGWFVGLYDINRDAVAELLETEEFNNACGCFCDASDRASLEAAVAHFTEKTDGRLDAVVNNAGVLSAGEFSQIDSSAHDRMIDVNVKGLTHLAELTFPYLRDTEGATMVNLCSLSSVHGVPQLAVYSATKFYVDGLTEALAIEWAKHDIRVVSVKPPFVNTAMVDGMPEQLTRLLKVDMEPEEVAEAIWLAVSEKKQTQVLGLKSKVFEQLNKHLPEPMRHKLVSFITGY